MLRTALAGRRGRTAVVLHCLRSTKTNRVYLKQGILDNSVVTVPSFLSAGLWSSNEVTRLINCGLSENSSSASSWQRAARFMSNSKREEKQVCWNCNAPAPACVGVLLLCSSCKAIQPPDSEIDFFEILGVKKEFDIDVKDLEKRYKDLQKKLHPDLFATKSKREQNYSADQSAHVIRAYQTLLKPLSRATYLLELHGCDLEGEGSVDDPELLMEIMEMQEAVAATSDAAHASEIQKQAKSKMSKYERDFADAYGKGDILFAKTALQRMSYYHRVVSTIFNKF